MTDTLKPKRSRASRKRSWASNLAVESAVWFDYFGGCYDESGNREIARAAVEAYVALAEQNPMSLAEFFLEIQDSQDLVPQDFREFIDSLEAYCLWTAIPEEEVV